MNSFLNNLYKIVIKLFDIKYLFSLFVFAVSKFASQFVITFGKTRFFQNMYQIHIFFSA